MPEKIICTDCLHYVGGPAFNKEFCTQPSIRQDAPQEHAFLNRLVVKLDAARDICDKEGDGHFTLFTPAVQITDEEPVQMRAAA